MAKIAKGGLKGLLCWGVAAPALLCAGGAWAQTAPSTGLEVVVVTATKAGATDVQKTPLAISAVGSEQIDRSIINDVHDLQRVAPGLVIAQNAAFAQIYIRGVGTNNVFNGSDPDVTVQIDGVYISRPFAQFANFVDVERVEVLRGPQGTLYGRNAVGGTINVVSRLPTDQFHAKAVGTVGNASLYQIDGMVSGPIAPEKAEFSVAASYMKQDPLIRNEVPGVTGVNNADRGSARAQLRLHLGPNVEAITRGDMELEDDAVAGFNTPLAPYALSQRISSIVGSYTKVALNRNNRTVLNSHGVSEDIVASISPALTLKSITAYRSNVVKAQVDSDNTDVDLLSSFISERDEMVSEEVNASGVLGRLKYVGGLYFIRDTDRSGNVVTNLTTKVGQGLAPKTVDKAWGVFAQGDFAVTDHVSLTAGVRYTDETKDFTQNANNVSTVTGASVAGFPIRYSASNNYHAATPKFGITYTLPSVMVYATVTRGFKSGGFNFSSANAFQGFAPEYLWSYEGGIKTDLFEHRLRLNGSMFHYDYSNLQVQAFIRPGVVDITNAASASINGVEFETEWMPTSAIDVGGNISLLDTRYGTYIGAANTNFGAKRLNNAPSYTSNVFAQYNLPVGPGTLSARAQVSFTGLQYFTPANVAPLQQRPYTLVDAFLIYQPTRANWKAELWGKNLSNTGYITTSSTTGPVPSGRPGNPRTYGVRVSVSY